MKRLLLIFLMALPFGTAAGGKAPINPSVPTMTDMVLIYGGGRHRTPYLWTKDRMTDYVSCTDSAGNQRWLFDSFLFLELIDPAVNGGSGHTFATGYKYGGKYLEAADKRDWESLISYYCSDSTGIGAVDAAVDAVKEKIGIPPSRRKIVIGIPEPVIFKMPASNGGGTRYWGKIDGKSLDFSLDADRVRACVWFIDEVCRQFQSRQYRNVSLAGFYWIAESSENTAGIIKDVSDYLSELNLDFSWIPWYRSPGYSMWKSYGFTSVYLQPNYFFYDWVDSSRLDLACRLGSQNGMGMEVEFDERVLKKYGDKSLGYKLKQYLDSFRRNGVWKTSPLAYYQSSDAISHLAHSDDPDERRLYEELCDFVCTRPKRVNVMAHRGGAGLMPENTIPAMLNAVRLGANTLEIDLQLTKDRKVVVCHDNFLSHRFATRLDGSPVLETDPKEYFFHMEYDSVATYDVGLKYNPEFPNQKKMMATVPLISQLIDEVEDYVRALNRPPVSYNIEIKSHHTDRSGKDWADYDESVDVIMPLLLSKNLGDRLIIQSFDPKILERIHAKYPDVQLSYLTYAFQKDYSSYMKALSFKPTYVSPEYTTVTKEMVLMAHKDGCKVVPWTVDNPWDQQALINMGVDAIITNYPDRLLKSDP